ncbi:GlxA family transcriptional regulator [Aureimonas leprariae]|uniref:GlxA family transcriptional regulator n=2 Tax=Plantimonas leprariae TaxID=2615207 RepID=A0A7V7PTJ9_9HYPH|nr:GlxA family transcriptional regulator [Aureimonas leprariae]
MSYASALEPLRAANTLAEEELYRWRHLSTDGAPVRASSGVMLGVDGDLEEDAAVDAVLVCAGGNPANFDDPAVFAWLRALARRGLRVGGVSGGPYVLARAGLLDGHRATVHWEHAAAFREAFPRVLLQATLFEIDRRRLTCAGGVAALDMMHRIIGEDHGYDLARSVSDWFLQAHVRPGSGGQRLAVPERLGIHSPAVEAAVELMERRIEDPAARSEIAQVAGVSVRQLDRLFAARLGTSVERYYLALRLERASGLLQQTSLSVTEIAVATGFASASHFSRAFKRRFGRSPRAGR